MSKEKHTATISPADMLSTLCWNEKEEKEISIFSAKD
jgi:hypothetical protein